MGLSIIFQGITTAYSVGMGCGTCCGSGMGVFISGYLATHAKNFRQSAAAFTVFYLGKILAVMLMCALTAMLGTSILSTDGEISTALFESTAAAEVVSTSVSNTAAAASAAASTANSETGAAAEVVSTSASSTAAATPASASTTNSETGAAAEAISGINVNLIVDIILIAVGIYLIIKWIKKYYSHSCSGCRQCGKTASYLPKKAGKEVSLPIMFSMGVCYGATPCAPLILILGYCVTLSVQYALLVGMVFALASALSPTIIIIVLTSGLAAKFRKEIEGLAKWFQLACYAALIIISLWQLVF